MKPELTLPGLKKAAVEFCRATTERNHPALRGVTDGKAIGTYIETAFKDHVSKNHVVKRESGGIGIDLPSPSLNTDIKATSVSQPQSSSPFRSASQKVFGLGHNILLFVYDKDDSRKNNLRIVGCTFVEKSRTADYQTTSMIRKILSCGGSKDDVRAVLEGRNLPADGAQLDTIVGRVMRRAPEQGYLTVSNALQWRLQYGRVARMGKDRVRGVERLL